MHMQNNVVVDSTDYIGCDNAAYPGRILFQISSQAGELVMFLDLPTLRRLHRAVGDYLDGPDGSTDREDIVPAEAATGCEESERGVVA